MTKSKMPEQVNFEQAIGKQIKVVVTSRYNDLLLTGYSDNSFSMLSIGDSEPSKLAKAFHTNQRWVPVFSMDFQESDLCKIFPKEIVGPWFGRVYSPISEKSDQIVAAVSNILEELKARKQVSVEAAKVEDWAVSAHEAAADAIQEAINVVVDRLEPFIQVASSS
jgi:hypothetical protein